ncbi:hypothetical protein ACLGI4_00375 [Streptomyces sp. HMX112]|uniref:hypothetical protein n=1 Tax=Streptomyces sp. HMX112 TaxID=3390850 RepID=UPI003A80EAC2
MNGSAQQRLSRHEPVVRVLRPTPGQQTGAPSARTARVPEPPWWRDAPAAVADVLARLPGFTGCAPLHFAVAEYCAVAGELYTRRVDGRKYRLRPSASTELEPSRLLTAHADGPVAHHEAYFHCGPGDGDAAEQAARAALAAGSCGSAAILRVRCSESLFRLTGELISVAP